MAAAADSGRVLAVSGTTYPASSDPHNAPAVTAKSGSNYKGFLAGVASGVAKCTVGHPFDTVKVRLQTSTQARFSGPLDCCLQTLRKEGIRGFYKGMTPPLIGWMASDSVMLGSLTLYRKLLLNNVYANPAFRPGLSAQELDKVKLPILGHGIAGIGAGFTVSFIAAPAENIKARLQTQYAAKKSDRFYKGPVDCTTRILKTHGLGGIYRGFFATCLFRSFFFFWWTSYEIFTQQLQKHTSLSAPAINFWAGGMSAQIFWLTAYPSDVVKQRIMTDPLGGKLGDGERQYRNWREAARAVYRNNADGSATYTNTASTSLSGSTITITCGVNYALEVPYRSDERPSTVLIEVNLCPHNGVSLVKERHVESLVRRVLESLVIGEETPRALLQVSLQVMDVETDETLPGGIKEGGQGESYLPILAAAVDAAVLGCLDASVVMRDVAAAVLVVRNDGVVVARHNVSRISRRPASSTAHPPDKPIVLEQPDKFRPPSHPARLVKSKRPNTFGSGYNQSSTAKEQAEQKTRRYPHTFPNEGTVMHKFLTNRSLHVFISLGTLTVLACISLITTFTHTSPYAHLLPDASSFLWHPLRSLRECASVYKLDMDYRTAQAFESRQQNILDAQKRRLYRRAHGLEDLNAEYDQGVDVRGIAPWDDGLTKREREKGEADWERKGDIPAGDVGRLRSGLASSVAVFPVCDQSSPAAMDWEKGKDNQNIPIDLAIRSAASAAKLRKSSKASAGNDSQLNTQASSRFPEMSFEAASISSSSPFLISVVQRGKSSQNHVVGVVVAGQLISLCLYLSLLAKTAFTGGLVGNAVPKLFLSSQLADYSPILRELTVSVVNAAFVRGKERDKLRLSGPLQFPPVDVIITCCKERLDVILDTVIAACHIRWPAGKLTILVSDDGKDAKLKQAIEELSLQYPYLKYFSREVAKGKHHGYKSGNVNQALSEALGGDFVPNPFFFCLDADMIPHEDILSAVVPHAVQDPDVGLVSLPQDFYNIPVNDPLNENLVINHEYEQAARDKMDAAWCLGSGFLVRREAWETVGGFCEGSICEDMLFSWCLNGAGWKTIHVNERLQTGLQPETFADHVKQRRRWCIGSISNAWRVRFGFWPVRFKNMTALQHLACVLQCPEPLMTTILKAWTWFAVTLCLSLNRTLVNTTEVGDLVKILSYFLVFVTLQRLKEFLSSREYGITRLRRRYENTTWLSLHLAAGCIKEMVTHLLGIGSLKFSVTGAREASLNERNEFDRPGALGRVWSLHKSDKILWDAAFFCLIAYLICVDTVQIVTTSSGSAMWLALLTGPLFPGMGLERIVWFLSPLRYALFPPTMKERHAYMFKAYPEHSIGGYRPLPEYCGARFTKSMWWLGLPYAAATVWAAAALAKALML
ncbi:hypothetical protein DV738_g3083, partial [Chaetothyriales sp. CBS 135597]